MKIIERRIVFQDWFESEDTKSGWDSYDWRFLDDPDCGDVTLLNWIVVEHLKSDKFGNPTLGIAEKETKIYL